MEVPSYHLFSYCIFGTNIFVRCSKVSAVYRCPLIEAGDCVRATKVEPPFLDISIQQTPPNSGQIFSTQNTI